MVGISQFPTTGSSRAVPERLDTEVMKLSRIAAGGAGLALVAVSTFVGATAASAVDVVLPSIPAETSPYSPGWFAGNVSGGDGTAVQSAAGLLITGGTNGYQLLNGDPASVTDVSLTEALNSPGAYTSTGEAFFQISVFGEPGTQFTTLRPVVSTDTAGAWYSSQSVAGLTANTPYTAAELIAALDGDAPAEVLAFGVFVNAGTTANLTSIVFDNEFYAFNEGPVAPTLTVAPGTVTPEQLVDPGVNVTLTGTPGYFAYVTVVGPTGQEDEIGSFTIDETGVLVVNIVWEGGTPAEGTYTVNVGYSSGNSGDLLSTTFVVKKALAATGLDATSTLLLGGVLLAAGAGIAVATLRRKAAQA